jgi:putative permease
VVYLVFLAILILFVFGLLPYLGQQLANLVSEVPLALKHFHAYLHTLPTLYPALFSHSSVHDMIGATTIGAGKFSAVGKMIFSASVSTIPNLITWLVYLFLVPLLVWFFLKDKFKVMAWFNQFIPLQRGLIDRVAREMKVQLGNYVRGKVIEGLIVSIVTYIGFICFGLEYAFLLAFAVGVSVIIPYVGMVLVTIPVVIIGLMQWGPSAHFAYMLAVYFVIQALDGNLLVPVLFSEKVNLHPIAIIAAVLIFGGIWGFWGLFFAIPLATLVRAIVMAWMESVV